MVVIWLIMVNISGYIQIYPLVNEQKTMENHHFLVGKSTISMAMFNSCVSLPEGACHQDRCH